MPALTAVVSELAYTTIRITEPTARDCATVGDITFRLKFSDDNAISSKTALIPNDATMAKNARPIAGTLGKRSRRLLAIRSLLVDRIHALAACTIVTAFATIKTGAAVPTTIQKSACAKSLAMAPQRAAQPDHRPVLAVTA